MRFNSDLVSSYLQPDINKFPSAHNRGHDFRKIKSLQGCPNLAHHKLSWSTKDKPSPGKTRSVSESRFKRHLDNGKTRPAKPPDVPTNPDWSCTYLVLRATPDEHYVQLKPALKFPRGGAASGSVSDQHLDKHWPGGLKIKMTLGLA